MQLTSEVFEDDEQIDLKTISYEFILLEGIRETAKLFREDWQSNYRKENQLVNALNSLDALFAPLMLDDKEYEEKKKACLTDYKGFFRLMVTQLYTKNILGRKKGDVV